MLATFAAPPGRLSHWLAQHDDRGFLADAFGVAPRVAIENQVAQHDNAWTTETFKHLGKILRAHAHSIRTSDSGELVAHACVLARHRRSIDAHKRGGGLSASRPRRAIEIRPNGSGEN